MEWEAGDDKKASEHSRRLRLAAERLRERLSCAPFYAKRAAQAKVETGDDLTYWASLVGRLPECQPGCSTSEPLAMESRAPQ